MDVTNESLAERNPQQIEGQDVIKGARVVWSNWLHGSGTFTWDAGQPKSCLIVKKRNNQEASAVLKKIATWLADKGIRMYVEKPVHDAEFPQYDPLESISDVDFCVTLGGDGTVLHLSKMFEPGVALPPVLCFAMGTLGFLTPLDYRASEEVLCAMLGRCNPDNLVFTSRMRNQCCLYDENGALQATYEVLNECSMGRGAYPEMLRIPISVDGHSVTTVLGDGLVVATSTGSTAYAMSAGGPIMLPNVPASVVCPIAAFSLSFRPLIVASTSEIELRLEASARHPCQITFDGQSIIDMHPGWMVRIRKATHPLPLINIGCAACDWYAGIVKKLGWATPIKQVAVHLSQSQRNMLDVFPSTNNFHAQTEDGPDHGWLDQHLQ